MPRAGAVIAIAAAAAAAMSAFAGPARAAELPRPAGLYSAAGPALPMLDSQVEIVVRGPIVEVVVTQRFHNRADHPTEATYIFPLPEDAAVSAMAIHHGNRTIRAAIERRADAQRRYEDAVRQGVAAAVLDQERSDVFTQAIGAIPAKTTIEVTLRYDTVARYHDGTWELALPMVVAPRYVPGAATARPTTGSGRAPDTDRAPDASRVTPGGAPGAGGATTVSIRFADPVREPTSPTHELRVSGDQATFTDPRSDHDAIVRWRAASPAAGWVEPGPDGGYAAVIVEAPPPAARRGALRCFVVLDRSAAARGDADAVALPFVRAMFGAFTGADRVAVAGSEAIAWTTPADASRAVEQTWHQPAGAFDLTRVLAAARPDGAPIVLVSGGLVADDRAAIAAARKLGVPIHAIGVGPAPARALLTELAAATGGTVRFLAPGDDLGALARAALADAATTPPPLSVNWGTLAARDVVPGALPRLGAGQAMLVLARVARAQTANVRARGELFAIETLPAPRVVDGATTPMGPLARRWARSRLAEMLAEPRGGNAAAIASHALRYGLVSPHTSLVAIGDEVIVQGGVKRSVAVPVSVPAGMHWRTVKKQTTVDTSYRGERTPIVSQTTTPVPKSADHEDRNGLDALQPSSVVPISPVLPSGDVAVGGARAPDFDGDAGEDAAATSLRSRSAGSDTVLASESTVAAYGPRYRFSMSLGAGIALAPDQRDAIIALAARFELGRQTLFGVGGALWLVDGLDPQGQLLATAARRWIARWYEVGAGLGVQLGEGVGPAGSLSLRYHPPPFPRAAGYLRYDGALLFEDEARRGQHALTLGVEWSW